MHEGERRDREDLGWVDNGGRIHFIWGAVAHVLDWGEGGAIRSEGTAGEGDGG